MRTSGQEWPENAALIWSDHVPADIRDLFEVHDYHHASAILSSEFPSEFREVCDALRAFRISTAEIKAPGGNESDVPKKVSAILRPSWKAAKLQASMVVDDKPVGQDTHIIDYVKGRVAFDVEWNSKDQTFDRDLFAFSEFFKYKKISVGVILTRSNDLDDVFVKLGKFTDKNGKERLVKDKYGASTTHMGKLLPRLDAGRQGGCPVVVFGITRKSISDWKAYEKRRTGS
jgi:hypothetical protein